MELKVPVVHSAAMHACLQWARAIRPNTTAAAAAAHSSIGNMMIKHGRTASL